MRQAWEVRRDSDRVLDLHLPKARLACRHSPERRFPAFLELGGNQSIVGIASGIAPLGRARPRSAPAVTPAPRCGVVQPGSACASAQLRAPLRPPWAPRREGFPRRSPHRRESRRRSGIVAAPESGWGGRSNRRAGVHPGPHKRPTSAARSARTVARSTDRAACCGRPRSRRSRSAGRRTTYTYPAMAPAWYTARSLL
jgi:hypothetical protein